MTKKQRVMAILGGLHLLLAITSIFNMDTSFFGRWQYGLIQYKAFTGTDSKFGFFASGLVSDLRVKFIFKSDQGEVVAEKYLNDFAKNHEVFLRIGNIKLLFLNSIEKEELRQAIIGSWVAFAFSRVPTASSVELQVDVFSLASLKDYADKPIKKAWKSIYKAELKNTQGNQV